MTLLERPSPIWSTPDFLAKIREYRAKPTPYTFEDGKIPRLALVQGVFWRDRTGKLYEITEMHPLHAQRAAAKLWGAFGKDSSVRLEATPLWRALAERASVRA